MTDKCPVCNHDLIAFTEGSTTGVRCSYCDYSLMTTYIEPIYEDENTYTITLEAGNTADQQTIKAISKITGENYIFAKRCLENTPIEIVKGKEAGLQHMRIHDLRHSHVSMLWHAGVPVPEISKRIGHASPKVTMERYAHIFDNKQSASLAALNSLVKEKKK